MSVSDQTNGTRSVVLEARSRYLSLAAGKRVSTARASSVARPEISVAATIYGRHQSQSSGTQPDFAGGVQACTRVVDDGGIMDGAGFPMPWIGHSDTPPNPQRGMSCTTARLPRGIEPILHAGRGGSCVAWMLGLKHFGARR